jgi:hypothetical protein
MVEREWNLEWMKMHEFLCELCWILEKIRRERPKQWLFGFGFGWRKRIEEQRNIVVPFFIYIFFN